MKYSIHKNIAVVMGRFQPLHIGHLYDYILEAWKSSKCDYLLVGITNSDRMHTKVSESDPRRSLPENNPLSFIDRLEMIKRAILDEGIKLNQFDIIPFPINFPEELKKFAPEGATYYLTIFDEWGDEKEEILRSVYGGENVKVLYRKPRNEKRITATEVRQNIREGKEWKSLVPRAISTFIEENDLINRIIETQRAETVQR